MDYKKEYEEMVQRVKELHETGNALTKKQMEIICPELAESEDERIRRTLVEYFGPEVQLDLVRGVPIQKIRDWLEKQKEQKHPDGCFTCDEYKKGCEEGRRNGFTAGYNKAIKEVEQKEQKPAEIHIDNPNIQKLNPDVVVETRTDGTGDIDGKALLYTADKSYKIGFRDGVASVKPADVDEYKIIKKHITEDSLSSEVNKRLKECGWYVTDEKPAEWSEEDEDMLNSCISSIEEAKENRYAYKETDGDTSYDHEIAWLKLLRNRVGKEFLQPHWKPSEWQMSMLLAVINDPNNAGSESCYLTLKSIYEQLKKLM